MSEPLQIYARTIRLPAGEMESGRSEKARLDARIQEEINGLSKGSNRWRCEWHKDDSGNLAVTLATQASVISLQTKYGRNVAFAGKERQAFISYGIQAESRITALDQAAHDAENLRLLLKVIGGVLGPVLLFCLFYLILQLLNFVIIPHVLIVVSLLIGIWGGGKLGSLVGAALENRAEERTERKGIKQETNAMWGMLVLKLDQVIEPYPRV